MAAFCLHLLASPMAGGRVGSDRLFVQAARQTARDDKVADICGY